MGPTVEQLALDACGQGPEALAAVLGRWRGHLRALEVAESYCPPSEVHPFRREGTRAFLPADHFDVGLHTFVVDAGGELHHVGPEWELVSAVDADLVCARALWWFAADVVRRGVNHPWLPTTHVDALGEALALLCSTPAALDAWRTAEGELQAAISDRVVGEVEAELTELGLSMQTGRDAVRRLPFTQLRRRVAGLGGAGP